MFLITPIFGMCFTLCVRNVLYESLCAVEAGVLLSVTSLTVILDLLSQRQILNTQVYIFIHMHACIRNISNNEAAVCQRANMITVSF